jgi:hypothetical protein
VREVVSNIASGSTLYAEAKRLNDLGIPAPGWRYVGGKRRPGAPAWSVTTVSRLVHGRVYTGTHEVRINGGEGVIEQPCPIIVEPALQERALAVLTQNKRYPHRKNDRRYLLSGLVTCGICGSLCGGHPTTRKGKKYFNYTCRAARTNNLGQGRPHRASYVTARWLEEKVWTDVRQFLEEPGEVLERVREQLGAERRCRRTRNAARGPWTKAGRQAGREGPLYKALRARSHLRRRTGNLPPRPQEPDGELEASLRLGGGGALPEARAPRADRDSACVACGSPGAHSGGRGGHRGGVPGKATARKAPGAINHSWKEARGRRHRGADNLPIRTTWRSQRRLRQRRQARSPGRGLFVCW